MRALASAASTPSLAYAASVLFLCQFVATALGAPAAAAGIHLLFLATLVLLVMRVDAPTWARLAGSLWVAFGALADLLVLAGVALGSSLVPGATLGFLALVPGAAWVAGASLADPGTGRTLGVAASAGMGFSALLALTDALILVESPLIVRVIAQLTLALVIGWFAVLGRDLHEGKRHWMRRPIAD